jgi:hypothetical protein
VFSQTGKARTRQTEYFDSGLEAGELRRTNSIRTAFAGTALALFPEI